ncbi:hypothetical protein E3N88_08789 [Mikania micrantha]|uniref:Uncharacterized protein n=1 Tax=Mikania micrantha TaxID=192012 RepID=A0A5N6PJI3_9ASTR|nr:hypothetical protein E3N88_08789 [Mikania micrantha]
MSLYLFPYSIQTTSPTMRVVCHPLKNILPSFWWTISIEILVDRGPSRLKNIANAPQKSKGKGASSSSTPKVPPPKKTESKRLHQLIDEDNEDDEEMEAEFGVSEDDEEDVELGIDVDDDEEDSE